MSPKDAKSVIYSLARGIDPATGEVLNTDSVLNDPKVIRALFLAATALDGWKCDRKKIDPITKNAGLPWSSEEDTELLELFDSGKDIDSIALTHGRTVGAIKSRLIRHGRLQTN